MIGKCNFAKVNLARRSLTKRKVALKTNDKTQLNLSTLQKVCQSKVVPRMCHSPIATQKHMAATRIRGAELNTKLSCVLCSAATGRGAGDGD